MKALAKPVDDRYQSAAAMKADIDRYLAGKPVQAPPVPAGADDHQLPAGRTTPTTVARPVDDQDDDDGAARRRRADPARAGLLLAPWSRPPLILGPKLLELGPRPGDRADAVGMTQAQAEQRHPGRRPDGRRRRPQDASDDVAEGPGHRPGPRRRRPRSTRTTAVDFTVSTGKPDSVVPDVVGDNKDSAADQLRGAGLRVKLQQRRVRRAQGRRGRDGPRRRHQVADGLDGDAVLLRRPEAGAQRRRQDRGRRPDS